MLKTGELFAGYRIVRRLGSGGMGEVYLADHPRLSRQDAIKVLSAELSEDPDFTARFRREADLSAALWHPHIVGVHDCGEFNSRLWLSMDFVDGTDAAHLLADNPHGLSAATVADIVEAIAAALDFAHQRGMLHRDVKPANILLTSGSHRRILLADFGIGRDIANTHGLTATNMTIGTVSYAAPEQLMGEDVDGRTDQYALAATAYHLLAGRPVFEHSNPTIVISRHLNALPPRLAEHRPEFAFLDPVLQQALAKDPAERFASCTEFAAALRVAADAAGQSVEGAGNSSGAATPSAAPIRQASVSPALRAAAAPTQAAVTPRRQAPEPPAAVSGAPAGSQATRSNGVKQLIVATVAAAVTAVAVTALILWRQDEPTPSALTAPSSSSSPPPATSTVSATPPTAAVPPPVPAPTRPPPTTVTVPASNGSAGVITRSGKTACQILAANIGCQVDWEVSTPLVYGSPANGVRIYADGDWEWAIGNMSSTASFTTLEYGTTYRALGWTIEPTADGTTFTNNSTGHGIVVSTGGIRPF